MQNRDPLKQKLLNTTTQPESTNYGATTDQKDNDDLCLDILYGDYVVEEEKEISLKEFYKIILNRILPIPSISPSDHASIKNSHNEHLIYLYDKYEQEFGPFSTLCTQVAIGFARDLTWGIAAHHNTNYFENKLNAFWGPTFSQMLYTLAPIIAAPIVIMNLTRKSLFGNYKSDWIKKQAVFALSSWSSIPIWNGAQYLGDFVGNKLNLNSSASGYFSGVFCGIAETVWQGGIVTPTLLNNKVNKLEVLLNTLSGAVWQWVFQAHLDKENPSEHSNTSVTVGTQIACSVAATTVLMTLLAWAIDACYSSRNKNTFFQPKKDPVSTVDPENNIQFSSMRYSYK